MNAIERAAREAIPSLADFCLVHVVSGGMIRCVAGVHVSRLGRSHVRALMRCRGIRRDDLVSSVASVVRTQRPILRPRVASEPRETPRKGGIAELQQRLAPCSVLVVPIVDDGTAALGALSLCYSESARTYTARQLKPARRIAMRIARFLVQARDNVATRLAPRDARQAVPPRRRAGPRN